MSGARVFLFAFRAVKFCPLNGFPYIHLNSLHSFYILSISLHSFCLVEISDSFEDPEEDEGNEISAEDDDDEEEDPRKKKGKSKSKGKKKRKYHALWNKKGFCVCKVNPKKKKGDEMFNDDEPMMDQSDFEEGLMELDPSKASNRALSAVEKAKKQAKEFHKLVSPFFHQKNLGCYCTKDRYVLK